MNTLLLAIDSGKLIQPMHFISFVEYDMRNITNTKSNISEYLWK